MRKLAAVLVSALTFGSVASAQAATITTSMSDWVGNAGGTQTLTTDFNVLDGTSINSVGLGGFVTLADGQTMGIVDGATVYTLPSSQTCCTTLGSGQVIDVGYNNEVFTFSSDIAALGFVVQPNATVATTLTVTLSDGATNTSSLFNVDFSANPTQFIGFYGAAGSGIDSISIAFTDPANTALYDSHFNSFDLANVVDVVSAPEPMSMAVLLTGISGLCMARRRRV